MFKIPKVQNSQYYIDNAMNEMQLYAQKQREEIQSRWSAVKTEKQRRRSSDDTNFEKRKDLELQKVRFLNDKCNDQLRKLSKTFPNFSKVDEIYIKLINTSPTPVPKIKDALGRIFWISDTIDDFSQSTIQKIKRAKTNQTVGFIMKKYFGKVNSLFKKNKEFFVILQDATQFMNKLPEFADLYTVTIAGFPNVGKSTLMSAMSGSKVEIQNYSFTTKGLMFGYIKDMGKKSIQLIDTPGLLGRDKNNSIEQRAQIVISEHCDHIVFVLDATQSCGFSIEQQVKLLKTATNYNKPLVVYLSKTDIFNEEDEERLEEINKKIKKFQIFKNQEELKEYLIKKTREQKKKFDPSKLKVVK